MPRRDILQSSGARDFTGLHAKFTSPKRAEGATGGERHEVRGDLDQPKNPYTNVPWKPYLTRRIITRSRYRVISWHSRWCTDASYCCCPYVRVHGGGVSFLPVQHHSKGARRGGRQDKQGRQQRRRLNAINLSITQSLQPVRNTANQVTASSRCYVRRAQHAKRQRNTA